MDGRRERRKPPCRDYGGPLSCKDVSCTPLRLWRCPWWGRSISASAGRCASIPTGQLRKTQPAPALGP
eukprot:8022945-Alexandrium_andersonii.AAC.1